MPALMDLSDHLQGDNYHCICVILRKHEMIVAVKPLKM